MNIIILFVISCIFVWIFFSNVVIVDDDGDTWLTFDTISDDCQ